MQGRLEDADVENAFAQRDRCRVRGDEFSGAGSVSGPTDAAIERLIAERRAARAARNFKESDRIRDELMKGGIILEDKPDGTTTWRRA